MYELEDRDHYYTVVETIAANAREYDPSNPEYVAGNCVASTQIIGHELATRHSAEPYAMDRLRPTDVVMYSDVGTPERPLSEDEVGVMDEELLQEQAVRILAIDLQEHADYTGEGNA
jgi:hypothetical protein